MLQYISSDQFRAIQDKPVPLEASGHSYTVQVTQVRAFTPHSERPETPFALILHAAHDVMLPQGIYRFHHPSLGVLDLFMVPIGPDARGMRYEVIFN
ncbi:MAG: hypothetical protein U1F68_11370 [Gammaproteobacteria bacterium]